MADMVRLMTSDYSNHIAGNSTPPCDIERALAGDFDTNPAKHARQRQNAAHIRLQTQIDAIDKAGTLPDLTEAGFVKYLDAAFYQALHQTQLWVSDLVQIVPGEWREHDVTIGLHVPPPAAVIPAIMAYFHQRFRLDRVTGRTARIVGKAKARHRFARVHPFQDGYGRVLRLMSHAMAHHAGYGAGGGWRMACLGGRITR